MHLSAPVSAPVSVPVSATTKSRAHRLIVPKAAVFVAAIFASVLTADLALAVSPWTAVGDLERAIQEDDFSVHLGDWTGSPDLFVDGTAGHLTPNGAARNLGFGPHIYNSGCIRVDDLTVWDRDLAYELSLRSSVEASYLVRVSFYSDASCSDFDGSVTDPTTGMAPLSTSWVRLRRADFPVLKSDRGIRLQIIVDTEVHQFFSSYLDDVAIIHRGPEELLPNARFLDDTEGWQRGFGFGELQHSEARGYLTLNSARVDGAGRTTIYQCINLPTDPVPYELYFEVSVLSTLVSEGANSGFVADFLTATDCSFGTLGSSEETSAISAEVWNRTKGTFKLPGGTRSLFVGAVINGAAPGAQNYFDDLSLVVLPTVFSDGFESGGLTGWSGAVGE